MLVMAALPPVLLSEERRQCMLLVMVALPAVVVSYEACSLQRMTLLVMLALAAVLLPSEIQEVGIVGDGGVAGRAVVAETECYR